MECRGGLWGQTSCFPSVSEAFLKSVEAFFGKRKETGEGLWVKKLEFAYVFKLFDNWAEAGGGLWVKNVDFSLALYSFMRTG